MSGFEFKKLYFFKKFKYRKYKKGRRKYFYSFVEKLTRPYASVKFNEIRSRIINKLSKLLQTILIVLTGEESLF